MATVNNDKNPTVSAADQRVAKVARGLRDQGFAPVRDLWTDIDAAITVAEQNQIRPVVRRPRSVWPKFAALAAAISLVVLGWWGSHTNLSETQIEETKVVTTKSDLRLIDDALTEVNRALAEAPDDANLSRRARKLYMSRGRVLREHARTAVLGG